MSTPTVPGGVATVTPLAARKRGRPAGAPAKEHKAIPAEHFVIEDVAEQSRGYLRRQRTERSREQNAVDRKYMGVYQEWVDAGSPTKWPQMPVKRWVLPKEFEDEALFMLGKANILHEKKLVIGKIQRTPLPDLPLAAGNIGIPFAVVSRKAKVTEVPTESGETKEV